MKSINRKRQIKIKKYKKIKAIDKAYGGLGSELESGQMNYESYYSK